MEVTAANPPVAPDTVQEAASPSEPSLVVESPRPQPPELCRFCAMGDQQELLITPCNCEGIISQSHKSCLEKRIMQNGLNKCSLCNFKYQYQIKTKPLREWLCSPEHRQDVFQLSLVLMQYMCDLLVIVLAAMKGVQLILAAPLAAALISAFACFTCVSFWLTYLVSEVWHYSGPLRRWLQQNTVVVLRVPKRPYDGAPPDACDSTVELRERD